MKSDSSGTPNYLLRRTYKISDESTSFFKLFKKQISRRGKISIQITFCSSNTLKVRTVIFHVLTVEYKTGLFIIIFGADNCFAFRKLERSKNIVFSLLNIYICIKKLTLSACSVSEERLPTIVLFNFEKIKMYVFFEAPGI